MNLIERTFNTLKRRSEGALIAYVTAGDPQPEHTIDIVGALISGGADIIELGIPFSEPIADGPTIQSATVRALEAGTTPRAVLKITNEIKENYDVPVVILSYYNPIYRMKTTNFFNLASDCDVDGLIVPDLPVEEAQEYKKTAESYEIDTIFLVAPSTSQERLKKIIDYTSGFIYLVSIFGVTGAREKIQDLTIKTIKKTLPYTTGRIPLAVGFGISKQEHVRNVLLNGADGVIVGSRFVEIIEKNPGNKKRMLKEIENVSAMLKKATKTVK